MPKSPHKPGILGNAPVNGRYFYIHRESRLSRTWDMDMLPIPHGLDWEQVSLAEYTEFRKETKQMSLSARRKIHGSYKPCLSASSPLSKVKTKKPRRRKSSE